MISEKLTRPETIRAYALQIAVQSCVSVPIMVTDQPPTTHALDEAILRRARVIEQFIREARDDA